MSSVGLTNLDRVLWPETGWTKGSMIGYYESVAAALVPHLRSRPVTLARFPTGVHEKGWYQTNCRGAPSWLRVARVPGSGGGRVFRMCVIDDVESLVWAANQGTIEFHPYLSTADAFDEPVALVFDLDPGVGATLGDCCRVALRIRELLAMDGLSAVAKTSGALGLHLYVGLRPGETFARTRAFARALAAILVAERPAKVTDAFTHAARAGRVLVDWRQNERGRSQVAPYSLRATPWPRVSTPIAWEEIASAASTTEVLLYFSPREVIERLGRSGDLFGSVLDRAHRLPPMRAARDQSVS